MEDKIKKIEEESESKDKLIKELEKENKLKDKLIKQLITDEILKEYISSDEVIKSFIELIRDTQFILHKSTLKEFMTNENLLQYELLESQKQYKKIDKEQYLITTEKTLNKKLDELKALKLIEISKKDYSITATDKLASIIREEATRVNKSTKSDEELKIITEDKLIAARLNVLDEKDEITKMMERYKYIYKVDEYSYVLGRKKDETLESIKKRIDYLVMQLEKREFIVYIKNKPLYLEKDKEEYYKIIYKDEFKTFENYLNSICDTTRSSDKVEFYVRAKEYYEDLEQEILNRNIDLEKVESTDKEELEEIKIHDRLQRLYNKIIIYVHESMRDTVIKYLDNKLKSVNLDYGTDLNYEIRKYKCN